MGFKKITVSCAVFLIVAVTLLMPGCGQDLPVSEADGPEPESSFQPPPTPPTLAEILDNKNTQTKSALGKFDFRNFTYPLPRGWQDADSKEVVLENGKRRLTEDKIGMVYVTTKYGDATGDGEDEAFVILQVATGGAATPHLVYIFDEVEGKPEIIWYFRTGDRADGGLKRVYEDKGGLIVELFGQDRYIFSQMETLKIVGDEPPLCCPTDFTRNRYKRTRDGFELDGPRLTYSLVKTGDPPRENLGEVKLEESRGKNK